MKIRKRLWNIQLNGIWIYRIYDFYTNFWWFDRDEYSNLWFTALHEKIHINTYSYVVAADIESRLIKSSFEPQNHTNDVVAKYLVFQKRSK